MAASESPHPVVQELLDQIEEAPLFSTVGPEKAREIHSDLQPDVDGPDVHDVADRTVPGYRDGPEVPIRIYRPDSDGPTPTVIYFHGGGFVLGELDDYDIVCRHLTNKLEATVVSVDYRLAPENPFPAAVEDAYAATKWTADNLDQLNSTGDLVVAGDSAGGNLSTVVSLMARDLDGPVIDYQVLIYPVVAANDDRDSYRKYDDGYVLDREDIEWFNECYYQSPIQMANTYASPLTARNLSELPPATVITAGFDPLRDQGLAYAERLQDAGVPVTIRNYEDMVHSFFTLLEGPFELDAAHKAIENVAEDVSSSLES